MKFKNISVMLLLIFEMQLASCTIEKRRYTSGFHIEHFSKNKLNKAHEAATANHDSTRFVRCIDHKKIVPLKSNEPEHRLPKTVKIQTLNISHAPTKNRSLKEVSGIHRTSNVKLSTQEFSKRKNSNVHPDAMKSFVSGLSAIGILFAIILLGLDSIWLIVALILATLFLGIAAGKLANRAFKDMQYSRDRFSGKGLAAAGMVLGVLSIAALVGLVLITLLGITFVLFT